MFEKGVSSWHTKRGPCADTFHKSLIYKVKLLILNPLLYRLRDAGMAMPIMKYLVGRGEFEFVAVL